MNRNLALLFVLVRLATFAQSPDSSTYFYFQGQEGIESVYYSKEFYKNGHVKSEGWLVKEKPFEKSRIALALVSKYGDEFALGVWRTYYKDGRILSIDSFGVNDTVIKKFYYYKKKRLP